VVWEEWVAWECKYPKLKTKFKNAKEINLFGVFFCF